MTEELLVRSHQLRAENEVLQSEIRIVKDDNAKLKDSVRALEVEDERRRKECSDCPQDDISAAAAQLQSLLMKNLSPSDIQRVIRWVSSMERLVAQAQQAPSSSTDNSGEPHATTGARVPLTLHVSVLEESEGGPLLKIQPPKRRPNAVTIKSSAASLGRTIPLKPSATVNVIKPRATTPTLSRVSGTTSATASRAPSPGATKRPAITPTRSVTLRPARSGSPGVTQGAIKSAFIATRSQSPGITHPKPSTSGPRAVSPQVGRTSSLAGGTVKPVARPPATSATLQQRKPSGTITHVNPVTTAQGTSTPQPPPFVPKLSLSGVGTS